MVPTDVKVGDRKDKVHDRTFGRPEDLVPSQPGFDLDLGQRSRKPFPEARNDGSNRPREDGRSGVEQDLERSRQRPNRDLGIRDCVLRANAVPGCGVTSRREVPVQKPLRKWREIPYWVTLVGISSRSGKPGRSCGAHPRCRNRARQRARARPSERQRRQRAHAGGENHSRGSTLQISASLSSSECGLKYSGPTPNHAGSPSRAPTLTFNRDVECEQASKKQGKRFSATSQRKSQ